MVLLHVHKALYFLGRMLLLHGLNPEGFILQMLNLHLSECVSFPSTGLTPFLLM